jgi:hypothetical protein
VGSEVQPFPLSISAKTARRIASGISGQAQTTRAKTWWEDQIVGVTTPDSAPPWGESPVFCGEFAVGSIPIHSRIHGLGRKVQTIFINLCHFVRARISTMPLECRRVAWHNLRATRQAELSAEFPLHVACYWMGNKQAVAAEHYLQVTKAAYRRAAKSAAVVLQNPAQQPAAANRTGSHDQQKTPGFPGVLQTVAAGCDAVRNEPLPPRGLEALLFSGQIR